MPAPDPNGDGEVVEFGWDDDEAAAAAKKPVTGRRKKAHKEAQKKKKPGTFGEREESWRCCAV